MADARLDDGCSSSTMGTVFTEAVTDRPVIKFHLTNLSTVEKKPLSRPRRRLGLDAQHVLREGCGPVAEVHVRTDAGRGLLACCPCIWISNTQERGGKAVDRQPACQPATRQR